MILTHTNGVLLEGLSMTAMRATQKMLRAVLEGKAKDIRIRGFRLRFVERPEPKVIRLHFYFVDSRGDVLGEYDDPIFDLREGDSITLADLSQLFTFRLD
jgi:hypothetical protein